MNRSSSKSGANRGQKAEAGNGLHPSPYLQAGAIIGGSVLEKLHDAGLMVVHRSEHMGLRQMNAALITSLKLVDPKLAQRICSHSPKSVAQMTGSLSTGKSSQERSPK